MGLVRRMRGWAIQDGRTAQAGTLRTLADLEPTPGSVVSDAGLPDSRAATKAPAPHPAGETAPVPWT